MTLLEVWIHTPLAQSLGFALLHSLWEGVLIAAILAAALCLTRSSRARYAAACMAMLLMLASFSMTLAWLMPKPMELAHAQTHIVNATATPFEIPVSDWKAPAPSALAVFLPWVALFWAAGVLFFHLRALGGWMAARRLRLSGVCRAPAEWQVRLDELARRLRVSRPATLLESCLAEVPVVIGYARPVILMPVGLLAGLPVAQVEAILIHELAHIRRHDYLVNLLQTFVEGLFFYHPAVWWLSRVIRAERENCCDDLAVAATGDPRQYAAALTALEQTRWAAQDLAMAATGGSLVKRIRRLLQQPERPSAAWTPIFSAAILVVSAGIAFASWQTQPAQKPQASVPATLPAPAALPAALPAPVPAQVAPLAPVAVEAPPTPTKKQPLVLLAQVEPPAPAQQAAQSVEEQLKAQLERELTAPKKVTTPYTKWLNEDVAYIITDAERKAFRDLTTDAEREHFIEQFWLIRDPTPGTPENEFKAEHYRRIAYTNEHFTPASGLPGWKTDRGRIYITFGPPDQLEDHPLGGAYTRTTAEGGGTTSTVPFQRWSYRFIEGIGNNIVIEFVDPNKTGEYRMTYDPAEKEALQKAGEPAAKDFQRLAAWQASAAATPASASAQAGRGGRGARGAATATAGQSATPGPANIFTSEAYGLKILVSVTSGKRNTGVNVALPAGSGRYDVIARVTDANGKTAASMRDVTLANQLDYPAAFSLAPGSYTLTLVTRDQSTGAMQTGTVNFYVN